MLMPAAAAGRRSGRRIRARLLRSGALRAVITLPAGAAPKAPATPAPEQPPAATEKKPDTADAEASPDAPLLLVGRAKYPGKQELAEAAAADAAATKGKQAGEKKHKRKTYGRGVHKGDRQLTLV